MKIIFKLLFSILLFAILTYFYCIFVGLILMIPIYIFLGSDKKLIESGVWVLFLVACMFIGSVLAFFSVKKMLFGVPNKVRMNMKTDKLLEEYNNK